MASDPAQQPTSSQHWSRLDGLIDMRVWDTTDAAPAPRTRLSDGVGARDGFPGGVCGVCCSSRAAEVRGPP